MAFETYNSSGGNGTVAMVIEEGGDIAIGTTNPLADGLTIRREGSGKQTLLQLDRPNTAGLQTNIKFSVANIMVGQIQHEYASSNYNHMSFTLRDPGGSDVIPLWLQNSGNVGIGTQAPAQKLHVQGTTSIIRVQSTSQNQNASIWFNSNVGGTQANRWEIGTNISAGGDLEFFDRLNSASRMVIEPSGKVGIGTINPSHTLDVIGDSKATRLIGRGLLESSSGVSGDTWTVVGLNTSNASGSGGAVFGSKHADSNALLVGTHDTTFNSFVVKGSGNVGIGTITPAIKLHVNTTGGTVVRFQSSYGYMGMGPANSSYAHHNTDMAAYYFPVNCQASGGFSTYSDSRLKENVEPVTGALDKVAIMNGVTFTWDNSKKAYGPEGKQFGVLAQNMLEVDSDLPSLREDALESQENIDNADIDTQYYTMDYSRLTPFFIEAIKELKTKLEAAEARLAALEG